MIRRMSALATLLLLGGAAIQGGRIVAGSLREDPALGPLRVGGVALARGDWDGAAGRLRLALAARDTAARSVAYHNLGLAHLHASLSGEGAVALTLAREARQELEEALRLAPGTVEAGWNLELAIRRIGDLEREEARNGTAEARRLLASLALGERPAGGTAPSLRGSDGKGREPFPRKGPPW